jgi:predicted lipoprotein with Yx(FWY)xxD motif
MAILKPSARALSPIIRAIISLAVAAVVPLTTLPVAGCGGGGSNASPTPSKETKKGSPTVDTATNRLGEVLVDSKGRTLYLFAKDKGTKSRCRGACASAWPPLRANGRPRVSGDAKDSKVGTTTRADGAPQVTYNGHPLYLYQGDEKPGLANGHGVNAWGGRWFALSSAGRKSSGKDHRSRSGSRY